MKGNKMKNLRSLAFWLIPPNLLLTSVTKNDAKDGAQTENAISEPKQEITPAVAPKLNRAVNITTTADFIWWKTHLSNAEYAWAGITDGQLVPAEQSPLRGNIKQPDFEFSPGFKVGFGLDFRHDGWDVFARYTWLGGSEESKVVGQSKVGLVSTFPRGFFIDAVGVNDRSQPLLAAKCHWKQHFNVVDLELGRNFFISRRLTLRPFFGLKTDWIQEKFRTIYDVNSPFGNSPPDSFANETYKVSRKEDVWGIGIRAGANTVWHFTRNWGLYGDIAATALWNNFHLKIRDSYVYNTNSPFLPFTHFEQTTINSYEKIQQLTPVIEASLGLIYMLWFNQEHSLFYAKAGWEEQIWVDYNQIIQPISSPKTGDLSLQGLTVEVGFTF